MKRLALLLVVVSLLASAGCGQPAKDVNKGKDVPVSPPAANPKDMSENKAEKK